MESFENISLPLSSGDPTFELLECFLDAFDGDIPPSAYLDPFEQDTDTYIFDNYTNTNKYLGEDLFILSSEDLTPTVTITNEIDSGDNLFNPFADIGNNSSASFALSSSDVGFTAGSSLETADIVWQFVDGKLEGAWYKRFDEEFVKDTTCIKMRVGSFEMRYPHADRGLSGEDIGWTGRGINNCQRSNYVDSREQAAIEEIYWADDTDLSAANSIALNQTTLIADGAGPHKNIFKADQIQIKPSRESTEEQFAWLFDFNHTELPMSCGRNQIYWPLFRYTDDTRVFPFNIPTDQCEDVALKDLHMTKNMCGAIAGLDSNTGDRIYKKSGFCGSEVEGAWLSGSDISDIARDLYQPALIEDICPNVEFTLNDGFVYVSGSCLSSFEVPNGGCSDEDACAKVVETKITKNFNFSGSAYTNFKDIVGASGMVTSLATNFFSWGSGVGTPPSSISFVSTPFTKASFNEYFEIGEVSFFNGTIAGGTQATGGKMALVVDLGNEVQSHEFPFTLVQTVNVGSASDNADSVVFTNPETPITFTRDGVEYTLEIQLGEIVNSGGFVEENTLYAFESNTATSKVLAKFTTDAVVGQETEESGLIEYNYQVMSYEVEEDTEYSVDLQDCILTIIADSTVTDASDETVYTISTDGITFLNFTNTVDGEVFKLAAPKLIECHRVVEKSISGASRQTGLHMVAPSGKETHFIWELPNACATEVLNGYDHDDHCNYLKLNTHTSIINAEVGGDVNQWKNCDCKAVYYSPAGNPLMGVENFDNYQEYYDIILEDVGVEPFSFATWEDSEGNDYRTSDHFAVFNYNGSGDSHNVEGCGYDEDSVGTKPDLEPDVGYGIGVWQTLSGKPLTLETGKSYVYRRASFGGCDDNKPPCFVVRNCHCFDRCSPLIGNPLWIKMVQNPDGDWVSTGEETDMVLEAGQFYEYEKRGEINYTTFKQGERVDRTTPTPCYSLNVPFENTLPYWAESPTIGALNIGLSAFETDDYLLTTQPKPSEAIIENDNYINYVRNTCEPFIWNQPVEFTVDFQRPDEWQELDFRFTNPPLLQKMVGCGSCDFVFDGTPDSCYLKDSNCNSYIGNVVATDTPSNMIIRTAVDCGSNTEIFYSAQNPFTFTQEVTVGGNLLNPTAELFLEAERPWANYLNGPNAIVRVEENTTTLKTADEIGVLKPNILGVTKVQCFGKDNNLV